METNFLARARQFLTQEVSILPLVIFRIVLGFVLLLASIRFVYMGWIDTALLSNDFHFTYYGFHWVTPLSRSGMYLIYGLIILASCGIMLGLFYRLSICCFFLLFTYVELIEKALYLNHYYFLSILSLLLIFLPLHRNGSIDAYLFPNIRSRKVPFYTIFIIQLQLGIVYFFAGIAKLKYDWLFEAQPLSIWLNSREVMPLLGGLFTTTWFPFLMSWAGALYDLSIAFLLGYRPTRKWAFLAVIGFHLFTGFLFKIGMFPYIMIAATLIFFNAKELHFLKGILMQPPAAKNPSVRLTPFLKIPIYLHFSLQLLLPLRHLLYAGNVLWTEEGFRYAWNVMLVEKTGYIEYRLKNPANGKQWIVYPKDYLTELQYSEMSYQADMILQFAHHLRDLYQQKGIEDIEVYADSFVSLNGRPNRPLIDPKVDLAKVEDGWLPYFWVLRY